MDKELKNSIQFLANKVGKTSNFIAPENYFKTVEESFIAKLAEENLPESSGFAVPKNYFNEIEDSILSKTVKKNTETKVVSLKGKILKMIPFAAAASILLFIGLNSYVFNTDKKITIDSISDADIEFWMSTNNINYNDVALVLQEDILNDNEFSLTNIKNESIEDYIISSDNINLLNEGF